MTWGDSFLFAPPRSRKEIQKEMEAEFARKARRLEWTQQANKAAVEWVFFEEATINQPDFDDGWSWYFDVGMKPHVAAIERHYQ